MGRAMYQQTWKKQKTKGDQKEIWLIFKDWKKKIKIKKIAGGILPEMVNNSFLQGILLAIKL